MAISRVVVVTPTTAITDSLWNNEFNNILDNALALVSPWTANMDAGGYRLTGLALGTAGSPAWQFTGDSDTGAFSPGANQLNLVTGGVSRLAIAADGTITIATPWGVASGGIGITSGTSGGILGFTGSTTLASSGALTANALLVGGGAGATPSALGSLGTTTTVLHGNASGAPTFGAISLTADVTGDLPFANLVQSSAASKLIGRGSASGAGDFQEITLGSGLSMSGTTLSASGGSSITADTAFVTASESTSSTTYTDLTTSGPSLTFTVGPSGKVLIMYSARASGGAGLNGAYMDFELSGGNTRSPSDASALINRNDGPWRMSVAQLRTGLTAASTTITAKYRVDGGSASFGTREIAVITW